MAKSLHTLITSSNKELFDLYHKLTLQDNMDENSAILLMCYPYADKDILTEEEIEEISQIIRFKLSAHQWGVDY